MSDRCYNEFDLYVAQDRGCGQGCFLGVLLGAAFATVLTLWILRG